MRRIARTLFLAGVILTTLLTAASPSNADIEQTVFAWEVSADGVNWSPVTLPHTNFGCSFCTRFYRTFVEGVPSTVSFRFGSDNEARMFVNGNVVFDDYYVTGVDFCTTQSCCALCCDTPANCNNVLAGQAPFTLSPAELSNFIPGTNEIRWQVNQQAGGSGFYTQMTVTFPPPECVAPPSDLVGWWPGDDNANDIVGGNNGTPQNGAIFAPGKVDQAFSFDGVNDFVQIPNSPSLNPTGSLSIDAWIFPTAGIGDRAIAAQWGDAGAWNNQRAYLFYVNGSGRLIFAISDDAKQGDSTFHHHSFTHSPLNSVPLNVWSHVAAVYDQTAGTRTIYLNGVPVADMTHTPLTITNSTADVSIGAFLGTPTTHAMPFSGLIDEVEIFNGALSEAEIQAIFNAGSAGKCKNQPPEAKCKDVTVLTSIQPAQACSVNTSVDNGSFDPDPGDPITLAQSPAGPYGKGTTSVTLTATDSHGASDFCTAAVTVIDDTPPSITCPAPVTVKTSSQGGTCSATLAIAATATDNCDGLISTSCSPGLLSLSAPGSASSTCSASDGSGNPNSCSTTLTLVDDTPPTVSCVESVNPSGKNVPKASNTNQDGFYKVGASDVCSTPVIMLGSFTIANGETIKITQTRGKSGATFVNTMGPANIRHFQVGPGDAVITATDGSGNQTSVTCLVPPPPK